MGCDMQLSFYDVWTFVCWSRLPAFLLPYSKSLNRAQILVGLHMYHLVRSVLALLCSPDGNRWFTVHQKVIQFLSVCGASFSLCLLLSERTFMCCYLFLLLQVVKTEYQARQTPHWHIALWVSLHASPEDIVGDSKDDQRSSFVLWLEDIFGNSKTKRCEGINVQIPPGGGRLNYINGYVSKVFLLVSRFLFFFDQCLSQSVLY